MIQKFNSRMAKKFNLNAILIFPFVYIKDAEISAETKLMIDTYKNQFADFSGVGAALLIVLLFLLLGIGIHSWWLLLLLLLPFILYNIYFLVEYLIKGDIQKVSFVKQAIFMGKEWGLPCEERTSYTSFSWLKFWKD